MKKTFFELGNDAFDKGNYKEAIVQYKSSLELENEMPATWLNLALSYFENGDYIKSLNICNEIIDSDNPLTLPESLFTRGNCYQALKEYKKAIEDFSRIIELLPSASSAYFNRANAREKLGDAKGAEDDRKIAELLDMGNKENNFYKSPKLGEIEDYNLEMFNLDKTNLLEEISLNPESYSLYFELGNAYVKIREFQKAIKSFNKAIELYPEKYYADAHQKLIAAYTDIKDYEKVVQLSDEFLKQNPEVSIVKVMRIWALEELEESK